MNKLTLNLPGDYSISAQGGMPSGVGKVDNLLQSFITILFIAVTLTALIFLIWAGITWITSQGDKSKIEASRKRIIYAIIGLIVAFSAYFIINIVGDFLGVKILNTPGRVMEGG